MKRLLLFLFIAAACSVNAQRTDHHEFANFKRYAEANQQLGAPQKGERRVVLMGNSITDNWPIRSARFFEQHPWLIGRGISGQTSYQFLLRFRQDVVELQPKVVVINYGTNDIAENTGSYDEDRTFNNVLSMVDIARANNIKVVLASCLPAEAFGWRMEIKGAMQKVIHLNNRVKAWAKEHKIPYVDYFSALVSDDGQRLDARYADETPAIHPNAAGYAVMESLLLPVIEKLR